jgi:3-isopropylmalate/(R)-2-methylmalate dehydratase small subunit
MNCIKVVKVTGRAIPVIGDDIDNDRIIPARYLKEISFSKMGKYPFFDERFNADGSRKDHVFNDDRFQEASILFTNVNFGCGSSREHAPQALHRWGIKAIVAESFGEIFAGNCAMLGIPAVVASKSDVAKLQMIAAQDPNVEFSINLNDLAVTAGNTNVSVSMHASIRKALLEGTWDSTSMMLENTDQVENVSERLINMLA